MNIETLAQAASQVFAAHPRSVFREDGTELASGFSTLYNTVTGQSKDVLLHVASRFVFKKHTGWHTQYPTSLSRKVLCDVVLEGDLLFTVRLPEFHYFRFGGFTVEVQEFVDGEACGCTEGYGWCEHTKALKEATGVSDCHRGNWKISGDGSEIVLFDFDGIRV